MEDALWCLEHDRWYAAVSTLLPVIEGLISERAGVFEKMRVGRRLNRILHTQSGPWETLSWVPALDAIDAEVFARRPAEAGGTSPWTLPRHSVPRAQH